MRKIFAILVAIAMVGVFTPMALADNKAYINVTLNPTATASITVTPTTWTPVCALGYSNTTANTYFTLENTGTVQANVQINASNTTAWTLGATADHNQFNLSWFNATLGPTAIGTGQAAFVSNFPPIGGDTFMFGLKIYMPTSSSTNTAQHFQVTFVATAT